ncbi:MAG: hypothetical protein AAEJ52_06175, partial [Myxococcota bacterium]
LHGEEVRADETTTMRTTRWTRDPRKPPKPKATGTTGTKLDAPLEAYPSKCDTCGHTATRAGGCVEIFDASGPRRMHLACWV